VTRTTVEGLDYGQPVGTGQTPRSDHRRPSVLPSRLEHHGDRLRGIGDRGRKVNVSQVFAGQLVGVRQVSDRIWLVTVIDYDLGYFDDETCRLEPIVNPFGSKVLSRSAE
jgi:hypothetical protein